VGETHACCVSNDNEVFTWGDNKYGQLGIDYCQNSCGPVFITAAKSLNITNCECGISFSVFINGNKKRKIFLMV
jgi:alpha-tubulin suppressor-like RCC1 family protein